MAWEKNLGYSPTTMETCGGMACLFSARDDTPIRSGPKTTLSSQALMFVHASLSSFTNLSLSTHAHLLTPPPLLRALSRRTGLDRESLVVDELIEDVSHEGQVEHMADDGQPSRKGEGDREEISKEIDEAEHFDDHPNEGPADDDQAYPTKEADGALDLAHLEEEAKGLTCPNDECHSSKEEEVPDGEQATVEEEQNAKESEDQPKSCEQDAYLLAISDIKHLLPSPRFCQNIMTWELSQKV
jgi:hypothetical protein